MKDSEKVKNDQLQYEASCDCLEKGPCNDVEKVSIIVHKKKVKNRKKMKVIEYCQQPAVTLRSSRSGVSKCHGLPTKRSSVPEINKQISQEKENTKSCDALLQKKKRYLKTKIVVNQVREYACKEYVSAYNNPIQRKWKVYRCQVISSDVNKEGCCCSCNSDAMFEVMKSLYDCYKKKNCDYCDCILCGHLCKEERRLGEVRKSLASVGLAGGAKERKEKIKKAEKAIEGKPAAEKEKILKDLAETGQPLPSGKTASEKAIIKKVRAEMGLPPEPKTAEEKAKMRKAEAAGLIVPLEGKSASQKEKILKAQADLGIPLPEGRTASEKALIHKIKAAKGIPEEPSPAVTKSEKALTAKIKTKSEKIRKVKGLVTPLEGKTPEQKEKILRGLAMQGIPLPEGKTASEKKIIEKVRVDLGLPPEPKTKDMKEKYEKAANAGLMQPLEGKTPKEKEKILQGLHKLGIPLPEGRTPSERALIAKVKTGIEEPSEEKPLVSAATTEKLKKAKAAGLLTPLTGKPPEKQKKILRELAKTGLPLPEGKTESEKELIKKVKKEMGVTDKKEIAAVESEKLRKAKAAGLLTPLEGKSKAQKEKILRGLAKEGIPLPVAKTASEKKIQEKVRKELGLPPEPKTAAEREKQEKAAAAGVLKPLDGLTPAEKEKVLRAQKETGIELPEGRTKSEKALIAQIKAESKAKVTPSEQLRKAKAAGLLTPLEGKTKAQKEKIMRNMAKEGIPLPEAKTVSEKKIQEKVRKELGLPPEPKTAAEKAKHEKAAAAGTLKPLEGLTPAEKERQLRAQKEMGIELPEGRTKSEKALISKIKAEPKGPPPTKIPSEQLRKARAAGLLTPLEGKSKAQKEKIIKGLAKEGIPLPVAKTASEKKIQDKVRKELGLPPEPKTAAEREKQEKAAAAGVLKPLEGLTPAEKEKVLREQKEMGIELPEGRTKSEKSLVARIKAEPKAPPPSKIPSEQLRKAKAAGLITPLEGKTPAQKEKIMRGLAKEGLPLPAAKTASEKKIQEKVRNDLGLPPEPKTAAEKARHEKAAATGVLKPLEGLSPAEKEKILRAQKEIGIELPEGRTKSEKELIAKVKGETPPSKVPSEKLRKAKTAGLLTPLEGKSKAQKEKIIRGLAKEGIPLPVPKTASEKKIQEKVRKDLGLPPEPKTAAEREKQEKAAAAGVLKPLEGLSPAEKEKILREQKEMGIELPEGRTKSEKSLVARIKAEPKAPPPSKIPSEQLRKAKAAGLITPLEGKTPAQKEKIMRGLAKEGLPLPAAKTASEKKIQEKVRKDLGLPPEPKTASERAKHEKAAAAGVLKPLESLTPSEKEKVLRAQKEIGIELPEGRTKSEKALIAKVKGETPPSKVPSEKLRKAKAAGLLTPLEGKSKAQKEKIIRGLAKEGIPLPVPKTASEKKIQEKVRKDLGLPPEPKTAAEREKQEKAAAAGVLKPLEGLSPAEKEKILREQKEMGIELPEGRTKSEKALVARIKAEPKAPPPSKIPSEQLRKAKAAGLLTPLEGKTEAEKERILRGLAKEGLPLPAAKTSSEKKIQEKVRKDLGLPPEPKTAAEKAKHDKAAATGVLKPLEGLTLAEKEKVLKAQKEMGIELPEGRTKSEKALIEKVKAETPPSKVPSEKLRKAKAAGLLTPLEGKSKAQKEKIIRGLAKEGIPLPEPKTASEKKIQEKVRKDLGLPPEPKTAAEREKQKKAAAAGVLKPLEGLSPEEKEKVLREQKEMGIELPEGRTKSEKALVARIKAEPKGAPPSEIPSEQLRKAKAAGLLTPLEGKTAAEKEKIMRGLAKEGMPLPVAKTASEKKIQDKVRKELGLPPEPKSAAEREKQQKAAAAGVLKPLDGLTPAEKEKVLRAQKEMGVELPEGRTKSEKALIAKVKAEIPPQKIPSEKLRKARAAGLITPLEGKTAAQKEKIIRGLAKEGIPLPVAKTASEKKIQEKVRKELGLPPEPKTAAEREKQEKAAAAGVLKPLDGLTPAEKEKVLRAQKETGIELPEGRTKSEKALIAKIKAESKAKVTPSEQLRKAKAAGLLTPLEGKTKAQKEKIMRNMAKEGIPLPEAKTASEKKIQEKVRKELGLPPEPKTATEKAKHEKAAAAGILKPLEGLTPAEKERQLRAQKEMGIELPEGRTKSEKALISKIKAEPKGPPPTKIPSEQLRKARAAGLLTPLEGKTAAQKEKILRGLAKEGIPLPVAKTASEKKIQEKVRKELGLPPTPKTAADRAKHEKAAAAGILKPLEGLTPAEKEEQLRAQKEMGIELPEGRTKSEKELIAKIKAEPKGPPKVSSEKLRKAKAEGLLTPLAGKTDAQREKILKGLAKEGIPLPEGKTASEKKVIEKVRKEIGLPREKVRKGEAAVVTESPKVAHKKTGPPIGPDQRQKLDKLTSKAMKEGKGPSDECICDILTPESEKEAPKPTKIPSEKLRKAEAAGLLTPLEGKSKDEKEKILRGLAEAGIPLPEAKTASDKKLTDRIRKEMGLPPEPKTASEKAKQEKAAAAGVLVPLEGLTAAEKERVLKAQADLGMELPEGRTKSEKALIAKIKAEAKPSKTITLPLKGLSTEEKEKVLRKQADMGLQLPEGKTTSEKAIISKIKAEQRPSKKLKGKAVGTESKRKAAIERKAAAGITETFEDIVKTTTCDRGCGCDKKKIRFKHSYVKIRVTSPDISSLCPCPNECIPGVKAGAFIDNEGIKVTVGVVAGVPSYANQLSSPTLSDIKFSKKIVTLFAKTLSDNHTSNVSINTINSSTDDVAEPLHERSTSDESYKPQESNDSLSMKSSESYESNSFIKEYTFENNKSYIYGITSPCSNSSYYEEYTTSYNSEEYTLTEDTSEDSFDSIVIVESESSLHLITNSSTTTTEATSVFKCSNNSFESLSTHYLYYQTSSNANVSVSTVEELEKYKQTINYSEDDAITSNSKNEVIEESETDKINGKVDATKVAKSSGTEYVTYRLSQQRTNYFHKANPMNIRKTDKGEPIIVINNLSSEHDISTIVDELLCNSSELCGASCIFVVVPTSDEESVTPSEVPSSTLCVHVSEHHSHWYPSHNEETEEYILPPKRSVTISSKGKKFLLEGIKKALPSFHPHWQNFINQDRQRKLSKHCQVYSGHYSGTEFSVQKCYGTDTTEDRPCCCQPIKRSISQESHVMLRSQKTQITGVVSEVITPLLIHQGPNSRICQLKNDVIQQASFVSLTRDKTTTTCRLMPCNPNDMDNIPYGAPHIRYIFTPNDKQCQCKPNHIKELIEQTIVGGGLRKTIVPLVTTGCGSNVVIKTPGEGAHSLPTSSIPKVQVINQNCTPVVDTRGPQQDPVKSKLRENKLLQQCRSGLRKCVRIRAENPVSLTMDGPKEGKKSQGCQCCLCENAMLAALPGTVCPQKMKGVVGKMNLGPDQMQVFGPQGGLCFPEPGGTYTQAGITQRKPTVTVDSATNPSKPPCQCYDKKKKKKKKNDCQCPEEEEDTGPVIIVVSPDSEINKELLRQKSDMTQTQSGFRMQKNKKPIPEPEPEIEYTLEDAVRYYAAKNPDRFRDILNPSAQAGGKAIEDCVCPDDKKEEMKNKKRKKIEKKSDCVCEPQPEEKKVEHFTGLKFTLGGKGSAAKGLGGICCFDMVQETRSPML